MKTIFLFLVAAAFAIPTFGASLVVFFLLKNWYDNRTVNAILRQARSSMNEDVTTELRWVNRAAIRKLFDRFCTEETQDGFEMEGAWFTWGVISHPMINAGRRFSLQLIYMPRTHLQIKAAPGLNKEVLSDHMEGVGSFRLAALGALSEQALKNRKV